MTHGTPDISVLAEDAEPSTAERGEFTALERRLLNDFQRDFPVSERPYAELADRLGVSEAEVLGALGDLTRRGVVSRVGPVFRPRTIGVSTLAAMAVPGTRLEAVARVVSEFEEVNHNYEREHEFNLWFVVTAPSEARLAEVLTEIEARTRLRVLDLPLEHAFHIDLGFRLW